MPTEISLKNFRYTDVDRYWAIRQGSNEVSFSYLVNNVVVDMDRRVLTIDVDDRFISLLEKSSRLTVKTCRKTGNIRIFHMRVRLWKALLANNSLLFARLTSMGI